ncbi:hypothetical protein Mal15_39800 [Stieleria maiorica]|uniref:Uncharacterized protein n=2 Tax=Stieleria maiorica TaxID=2795974 RepID=A0A5B9MGD2_9BACT|nr:hypothetical protein Mal15_39800 [Stieleria maiorica]
MRHFALVLGFSLGGLAAIDCAAFDSGYAANGTYQPPARWNNFRHPAAPIQSASPAQTAMPFGATVQSAAAQNTIEELPVPEGNRVYPPVPTMPPAPVVPRQPIVPQQQVMPPAPGMAPQAHYHQPGHAAPTVAPVHAHGPIASPGPVASHGQPCDAPSCASPYAAAAASPWQGSSCGTCATAPAPGPRPIAPWFGGSSLMFWNIAGSDSTPLVTDDSSMVLLRNRDLEPNDDTSFDVHAGRYFGCGQYAVDVEYMLWDPECLCRQVPDSGAGLRLINPALQTASINRGAGATTVYDDYDMNAASIQVIRDLRIQSLEVNLVGFGLMGARRLGSCSPAAPWGSCGLFGCNGKACGGAIGPLARAAGGRLRIQNSHGFRWFQLEDELEIGGDVDGMTGYGANDLYYKSIVENNLFGYQFGSRLSYCMGSRAMLNLGGKIGIYGNDAEFFHSITTTTATAYTNSQGAGAGDLYTRQSDISLAGLGELDLGLGYRISNCWSVNGGYRVLAACGVATAVGQMPTQYTSAATAGAVRADDCLILHGAYIGFDYNW